MGSQTRGWGPAHPRPCRFVNDPSQLPGYETLRTGYPIPSGNPRQITPSNAPKPPPTSSWHPRITSGCYPYRIKDCPRRHSPRPSSVS